MSSSLAEYKERIAAGDPEPLCAVDAWVWLNYNQLQLYGGPYTRWGHEFQIDILQCEARKQCAKKSPQMGGFTEMLVVRSLHGMRYGRYRQGVLYLFPTNDEVSDFSKSRFKPFLSKNHHAIGQYVKDTDTQSVKQIGDATLYFRGARLKDIGGGQKSSSKLKSLPVDLVVGDEIDEMDDGALELAKGRLDHSLLKEEFYLANATIPGYGIDKLFHGSDQRYRMIECQSCGYETCLELTFPDCLRRRKNGTVFRKCGRCEREIHPRHAFWLPHYPSRSKDMVGWCISQLNSVYTDPTEILDEFEDPTTDLVRFYNRRLAMAYINAEDKLMPSNVWACCGMDVMAMSHPGPCMAGVDVGKTLHILIGYRVGAAGIKIIKMARVSTFADVWDLCNKFNVRSIVFDLNPEIHKVREFCELAPYPAFGCEYSEHQKGVAAWNEQSKTITVNRTEVFDASHNLVVTNGGLEIPRKDAEVVVFVNEMVNTAKVLEEKKDTGARVYRYRKLGEEHYRNAMNYLILAAKRVKAISPLSGKVIAPTEGWYF